MPKYYVTDNNKQLTISRANKHEAAMAFVRYFEHRGILLQPYISVNEQGFNNSIDTEGIFSTDELLSAAE